ncbi:Lrp/AsnC family transcriptional regulator [Burkholderia sp. MS455]|nr:Lrp/AsnC family transcriptional regulator [Burkholderia sp. MS455]
MRDFGAAPAVGDQVEADHRELGCDAHPHVRVIDRAPAGIGRIEADRLEIEVRAEAFERDRIRALMSIAVQGNRGAEVVKVLRGHPNVASIHSTNGRWDLVAELHADSLEHFDRVLGAIRLIDGIASTETSILLSTHKA